MWAMSSAIARLPVKPACRQEPSLWLGLGEPMPKSLTRPARWMPAFQKKLGFPRRPVPRVARIHAGKKCLATFRPQRTLRSITAPETVRLARKSSAARFLAPMPIRASALPWPRPSVGLTDFRLLDSQDALQRASFFIAGRTREDLGGSLHCLSR